MKRLSLGKGQMIGRACKSRMGENKYGLATPDKRFDLESVYVLSFRGDENIS
jgi:hypothetical protein